MEGDYETTKYKFIYHDKSNNEVWCLQSFPPLQEIIERIKNLWNLNRRSKNIYFMWEIQDIHV